MTGSEVEVATASDEDSRDEGGRGVDDVDDAQQEDQAVNEDALFPDQDLEEAEEESPAEASKGGDQEAVTAEKSRSGDRQSVAVSPVTTARQITFRQKIGRRC